jgi:uncharacterized protein YjbI with pentapeptide repeats
MMRPYPSFLQHPLGALALCIAAAGAGCSNEISSSSPAPEVSQVDRAWVLESEFDADPALYASQSQIIVLELEVEQPIGSAIRENIVRLQIDKEQRVSYCIQADDLHLVSLGIERIGGGGTVLTHRRGGACESVTLYPGYYKLRLLHDSRNIPTEGKLAFLYDPRQPRLLGGTTGTEAPDFVAFYAQANQLWMSTDIAPPIVEVAASSVGKTELWTPAASAISGRYTLSANGGPDLVVDGKAGCEAPRFGNIWVYFDPSDTTTGTPVTAYFGFHDLGGYDFWLDAYFSWQGPTIGCSAPASTVGVSGTNDTLVYLTDTNTGAETFTATWKGYDCQSQACDEDKLPLAPGEVAFFSECNFGGTGAVTVFDTPQPPVYGFDNGVLSIRLGSGTFVELFAGADYQGDLLPFSEETSCLTTPAPLGSFKLTTVAKTFVLATDTCLGCNLAGIDLSGLDLSGGNFARSSFLQANLSGTQLDGAILTSTDFASADVSQASFAGADLTNASLAQTTMTKNKFHGAVLHCTNFAGSDLSTADFSVPADLVRNFSCRLNLTGATLNYTTFPAADWRYFDLTASTMIKPPQELSTSSAPLDLSGAVLNQVTWLAGKTLDSANLGCFVSVGGQTDPCPPPGASSVCAQLRSANLSEASLRGVCLKGAALQGANLSYSNLDGAVLEAANMAAGNGSPATITGAFLRDASLANANLTGVIANFANFFSSESGSATAAGATMTGAKWNNAYLANTDFSDTVLQSTEWTGAVLVGANFDRADLSKNSAAGEITDFSGAYLQGAVLVNATVTDANFTSSYWDAAGSGALNIKLQVGNIEFSGYWNDPTAPECVQALYPTANFPSPSTPITSASNICPDGGNGPCDAVWEMPRTPIDQATPASAVAPTLPGSCTVTDILWIFVLD